MPSPNLIASILANRTSKAAITVLGNSVALYNPPVRVAEEFAMIDLLSRGRLIAGFPVGTSMDTCYSYGVNPSQLRPRYYEGVELIRKAWTSDEPFAFNGEFNKHRYVNPVPRPYQQPHPPIWIPGGGSIETWDYCAENDFVYGALTYYGVQARPRDGRRLLEPRRGARQGLQPQPARRHPVRRRRRHRRRGLPARTRNRPSTSSTARCTCTRASPIRPATSPRRRCGPATRARSARLRAPSRPSTT